MVRFVAILVLFFSIGCATPYQEMGLSGGVSASKRMDTVFKIVASGNGYTSRERIADFALLKAAETTLENGYQYFIVIDQEKSARTSQVYIPETTTGSLGRTMNISKPGSAMLIKFIDKNDPAVKHGGAWDALQLKESIRNQYELD